jgi:uncharacterized membrane protein YccC
MTSGVNHQAGTPKARTPRSRALGFFLGLVAGAVAAVGLWAWWGTSASFDLQLALAGLPVAAALLLVPFRTRWIGIGAVVGSAPFWLFTLWIRWSLSRFVLF